MWCLVDTSFIALTTFLLTTLTRVCGQNTPIKYVVVEERQTEIFVGNVLRDSGLESEYSTDVINQLQFQFLTEPTTDLEIDAQTGIIRTNGRIDRDVICPMHKDCDVLLDVAVRPVQYFQIIKVTIQILDINDNWPLFPESQIRQEMLESSSTGFTVPAAFDADSPSFSIQDYHLEPAMGEFEIKVTNKLDGSTEVRVNLKGRLDREVRDRYDFQIIAFDGDSPPKTGSLDVTVIVLDTNDNSPVFTNDTYEVSILESAPRNTKLLTVTAVDPDIGDNGQVEYGFSPQTRERYGKVFGIDSATGEIDIKSHLDHEKVPIYYLVVTARDQGADSLPTDVTVIVRVLDINDHAPQISINTLGGIGNQVAQITENTNISTFVAHVKVTDKDAGRNGNFTCSLHDDNFSLKQIDVGEYQVFTAAKIDREQKDHYTLSLVCRDFGVKPKISNKDLEVQIMDVNDNPPVFPIPVYSTEVIENNYFGIFILQFNASDADAGPNGRLQYKIPSRMNQYFQLETNTGILRAKTQFNREQVGTWKFVVTVSDSGDPSRSATASAVIEILDVNDEKPEFSAPNYAISVLENRSPGFEVGSVTAEDRDSKRYNYFTYSFHSYQHTDKFFINPHTGRINTTRRLDREEKDVYYMTVAATDDSMPPKSSTASLTIYIDDINDNAPQFEFPNSENRTIQLSSQAPFGHALQNLDVKDADVDLNAKLSYQFLRGNELGHFILDPNSGDIIVNTDLKQMKTEVYDFVVLAKDHGDPQLNASAPLTIVVNESIPFPLRTAQTERRSAPNFAIVVSLACVSGVVILVLLLAIVIVAIRRREEDRKVHKYNCRMEALRMLTAKEAVNNAGENVPQSHKRLSNGSVFSGSSNEKPKKEVSFSLDTEDTMIDSPQSPDGVLVPRSWSTSPDGMKIPPGIPPPPRSKSATPVGGYQRPTHRPWVYAPKDIEAGHHTLDMSGEHELDSNHSGDGSNADSGRGPSEEGENAHRVHPEAHHSHPQSTRPAGHSSFSQPRISGYTPIPSTSTPPPPPPSSTGTYPWVRNTQPHLNTFATPSPLRPAGDGLLETNLDLVSRPPAPPKPARTVSSDPNSRGQHPPPFRDSGYQGSSGSLGRHNNASNQPFVGTSFGHSARGSGTFPQRTDSNSKQPVSKSVVV